MAAAQSGSEDARRHLEAGAALALRGDPWAAADHFVALVDADPADPIARKNLAAMLLEQPPSAQNTDAARDHLVEAIRLAPRWAEAHFSLGLALERQGDHHGAMTCYQRALALDPEHACAHASHLSITRAICDWAHVEALWERSRHWIEADAPARELPHILTPLTVVAMPSTAAEQHEAARRWAAPFVRAAAQVKGQGEPDYQPAALRGTPAGSPPGGRLSPGERREARGGRRTSYRLAPGAHRLRLGYLSADFRDHPVARQVVAVMERHDRARVHVAGYSLGPDDDSPLRARIRASCDQFIDLSGLPAAEAAWQIAEDGTDVLIDLNGWTGGYRPEITALRPAPVQVSYLGYPATMGAPFIDYVVTDGYLTPPSQQRHWSERFACLPDCYMPADTQRAVEDTPGRTECGLPKGGFVFCAFNHTAKITPAAFDVWMRLLQGTPGSVLWLVASHPCAPNLLRNEAEARGVDAERLVFAEARPHAEYLACMSMAGLFLDTWPYTAGATANDALWAGLPVLTVAGETYVSRMAAGQLRAVGLPDLVMPSPAHYERTALALAHNAPALAHIRRRLAENSKTWPLFDVARYTRHLEDAYGQMHRDVAARAD